MYRSGYHLSIRMAYVLGEGYSKTSTLQSAPVKASDCLSRDTAYCVFSILGSDGGYWKCCIYLLDVNPVSRRVTVTRLQVINLPRHRTSVRKDAGLVTDMIYLDSSRSMYCAAGTVKSCEGFS